MSVCNLDTQVRLFESYCGFNSEPYCSDVCGYQRSPQTLAEICRSMGYCGDFWVVAARGKYQGVILLGSSPSAVVSQCWLLSQESYYWEYKRREASCAQKRICAHIEKLKLQDSHIWCKSGIFVEKSNHSIDSFTVPLYSPNGTRMFVFRALRWDCRWPFS